MSNKLRRFKKILVANRGEIAIRVLRAASELNIGTVAIFTFEDRYSQHRYKADEAYQIGADDEPLKPYLDIEQILQIAKNIGVDAIHPGYGFLSENEDFAQRCMEEGIVFIGPEPEVMNRLGDKVAAKKLARSVKVPLIEDSKRELSSEAVLMEEAKRIGFPIMVKAVAGGGGRGMRVVRTQTELISEYKEAKGEARTAFGDDTVFLEKFIENPKHIEVQILGDKYGNIVHLYERDCSVQRRFQKVVEVAPSVNLKPSTRHKLFEYALLISREVSYTHAGTVEFLVDQDEKIYFIEVNPRIQVEHTITEEITGIDIVRSQILIAMDYPLSHPDIDIKSQEDVSTHGYAIQCRITTEDPQQDFKPDYGTLIAYRSASGFGIRLDAGSAYPGAKISPFFDSMLVKVTAKGLKLKDAADRLHRALREFRIRGVKTNIGFMMNLLKNPVFQQGAATVNFIKENQTLLTPPNWRDRGTKLLRYLADVIVNGNPDVKYIDKKKVFLKARVPNFNPYASYPNGTKQILEEMGPAKFSSWLKDQKSVHFTDTTFRDGHQSLLATRVRNFDLLKIAESYGRAHGQDLFSMEVWGGATFDVALRFLKESPWSRLEQIRAAMPNTLLQMLLRGSNAVGYTAYPDNLIEAFIEQAWKTGIDVFRIFDSLNWIEAMKTSIRTVLERTEAIAEACLCYTGDISKEGQKFDLQYYVDLAKSLEDEGVHIIAIKDMAGLLKPLAAKKLITALKEVVDVPIHLHTHDTSSIQAATYLHAINAGVDIVDVALSGLSGLTSQPNFNSIVAMLHGHERSRDINLESLNKFGNYWEAVRTYYYPFETELRSGTAEVYDYEIPGGQWSNLRPQARSLGLEDQFETIKRNYQLVDQMLGGIFKVTPSSKVVGDMAMFMTSNNLKKEDIFNKEKNLAFPDSIKALMRGDLGQIEGGFPEKFQKIVLGDEIPYTNRPNAHLNPIDFERESEAFILRFGKFLDDRDFLSYKLYPKVFEEYYEFSQLYGVVSKLPSPAFFYGLKPNEEIMVEIAPGKRILIKYLNMTEPNEQGNRLVLFGLNGQTRSIEIRDKNLKIEIVQNRKVEKDTDIGAPLQGSLAKILVKEGSTVKINQPLFIIEAMKMESTVSAPIGGKVRRIHLKEKTLVEQDDLIIELESVTQE